MLTLHYLDVLVDFLVRLGLHPLVLPVLYLQLLIVHTTLSNVAALSKLLHMQYVVCYIENTDIIPVLKYRVSNICLDLSMLPEAAKHDKLAEMPVLVSEDLAR